MANTHDLEAGTAMQCYQLSKIIDINYCRVQPNATNFFAAAHIATDRQCELVKLGCNGCIFMNPDSVHVAHPSVSRAIIDMPSNQVTVTMFCNRMMSPQCLQEGEKNHCAHG